MKGAYIGKEDEGVIFRFNKEDMQIDKNAQSTDKAIPADKLDFSLDRGKTWMPAVSKTEKSAA